MTYNLTAQCHDLIGKNICNHSIFIASGISLTLWLLIGALFIGIILGTLFSISRHNKLASLLVNIYISIIRGTPLLLQLSFFYFAIPNLISHYTGETFTLKVATAGLITLGLNSSAYMCEIFRAGIDSLPKGQFEASYTLQIPKYKMWIDIILPQVIRNTLPALVHESTTLLKETALISTLGGMDIMRRAQAITAETYDYFTPLCIAAIYYYLLVMIIAYLGKTIERKIAYVKNK